MTKKCPVCGAPAEAGDRFCTYCGTRLEDSKEERTEQAFTAPPPEPDKVYDAPYRVPASPDSKWTAFFLCFFLGTVGVHRFYVGKVGTGLLWLFTAGLLGIGWLADIILIVCGEFKDHNGLKLKE